MNNISEIISSGRAVLGIEFGSTRIKAVLIGEDHVPIASGSHDWENRYENGIWTYSLEDIWKGLQDSYQKMAAEAEERYHVKIHKLAAVGFSAMMHGYMVFDREGELLVPFRTWRNTITEEASKKLTEVFEFPERRRECNGDCISDYACRLYTLETDRRKGIRCRRGFRYVPD